MVAAGAVVASCWLHLRRMHLCSCGLMAPTALAMSVSQDYEAGFSQLTGATACPAITLVKLSFQFPGPRPIMNHG
jgi:hypothetical protein